MKIKHFQGYGTVNATKIKDKEHTLHIKVVGNHEYGLRRDDEYDLFNWLVKRFDKSETDYMTWHRKNPIITFCESVENNTEVCDYYFDY